MLYLALLWSFHDEVNPRTNLVVRDDERHLVSISVIQEEKIKLRHTYQDIKIIAFLYETYEPQRWYFEGKYALFTLYEFVHCVSSVY